MPFHIRYNHERGKARALPFRCHHDSGVNKAFSLVLLSVAKVSNIIDVFNKQTCQVILCVSTYSPNKWRRRQGTNLRVKSQLVSNHADALLSSEPGGCQGILAIHTNAQDCVVNIFLIFNSLLCIVSY